MEAFPSSFDFFFKKTPPYVKVIDEIDSTNQAASCKTQLATFTTVCARMTDPVGIRVRTRDNTTPCRRLFCSVCRESICSSCVLRRRRKSMSRCTQRSLHLSTMHKMRAGFARKAMEKYVPFCTLMQGTCANARCTTRVSCNGKHRTNATVSESVSARRVGQRETNGNLREGSQTCATHVCALVAFASSGWDTWDRTCDRASGDGKPWATIRSPD